ncbi:acylneuraminate cytidylyltransferase family protein [Candidatus Woesearchaeota archaeon]|jgi:CMP-N,N'-diacetyllegionaminic acid synthase|nr:acylneuraminate cytidylyltransferase family protein [Candidatus Woesearchaeota archaeon]
MKIISVIPARGGSKGIPLKNLVDIKGKPLIYYSIQSSLKSNVDETWVSTDSVRISNIAGGLGARVQMRPDEIATDTSPSEETLLHFTENNDFDIMVFIQATSPLIKSTDINKGLEMMDEYDSVFSVYREHWIPRWSLKVESEWDIYNRPMRQQVEEHYVENGAFYITTRKRLLDSKLRYSGRIGAVEMPLERSFQVDTYDDLSLIKKLISD